jgi:hypothetical protein
MKVWCFDPQYGGNKIPSNLQKIITEQVDAYASQQVWSRKFQLKIRYRNQFCYLDASENGKEPFPIGRLRYFSDNTWSLAFYTYSNEQYQPCVFKNGKWQGTIEEAIDVCSVYLI